MQAQDVMTRDVVVVEPDTRVEAIARIFIEKRISAVPVVDDGGKVVGIVSEGDLMRRPENETETESWWLRAFASGAGLAHDYVKTHGTEAHHVMSREVISVTPTTPLGEIARTLEKRRIKRVPVLEGDEIVGIVSRANLLHGLAARAAPADSAPSTDDRSLRAAVLDRLKAQRWSTVLSANVTVSDGVVELWGRIGSEDEREALRLLVKETPGAKRVDDHTMNVSSMPARGYI